mmetsp:Transcript_7203/g.18325  ORF Transcript_7203/g.18325 Transcript_7203/m.18325 type:complete len:200 (-) Transcript_7203:56-655(-)
MRFTIAACLLATAHGFAPTTMVAPRHATVRAPLSMVKRPSLSLFKRSLPATKMADAALAVPDAVPEPDAVSTFQKVSSKFVNLFPVWTALFAGAALYNPNLFLWLTTEYFTAGLALLMLSMGITLTPKDFADVFAEDLPSVITQWAGCYVMMPILALALSKMAGLSPELTAVCCRLEGVEGVEGVESVEGVEGEGRFGG